MKEVNIGIIEDEPIVMESLQALFAKQSDLQIQHTARSVEAFLKLEALADVDILLLDINLPGMNGLEGMPLLKKEMPSAEIIMLTTYEDEEVIFKALCGGATSYISKRSNINHVLDAVRTVLAGGSYMSPYIARKVIQHFAPIKKEKKDEPLTPRQKQIVQALKEGYSYKMIANKYMISVNTVGDHIKAIYKKLQINSKGELFSKSLRGEI